MWRQPPAALSSDAGASPYATLSGCQDSKAVGVSLQRSFTAIFPSAKASDTDVSAAAIASLKADKTLACTSLN